MGEAEVGRLIGWVSINTVPGWPFEGACVRVTGAVIVPGPGYGLNIVT
jgi:hypothetical protein